MAVPSEYIAMVRSFLPRFSLKSLAVGVAVIALPCAFLAHRFTQIRAENSAILLLQSAVAADVRENRLSQGYGFVSRMPPRGFWQKSLYHLARSPGDLDDVRIIGDRSARVLAEHAGALRHLTSASVIPKTSNDDKGLITREQIYAVSRLGPLEDLHLSGNFAPDAQIAQLARIPKIDRLHLSADDFPADVIDQLASINADSISMYTDKYGFQFPSEAFSSFSRIRCTRLKIWGGVDDRAFKLIAMAPRLESLSILCTPHAQLGPQISDEGMRAASKHLRVSALKLEECEISDNSVDAIASIKTLKTVGLSGKEVTANGLDHLRQLRPDLIVD